MYSGDWTDKPVFNLHNHARKARLADPVTLTLKCIHNTSFTSSG